MSLSPGQLVMAVLPIASPLKLLMGGLMSEFDKSPLLESLSGVVAKLAEGEGKTPEEFIKSGRALEVLSYMAQGQTPPEPGLALNMSKCQKCNHVQYLIN